MRTALVTVQIALAFMLLTGAGLLIRSFRLMREIDLGYEPRNVLTGFLALPEPADGNRTRGVAVYRRLRERIEALPGIRVAALSSQLPMGGVTIAMHVTPQGMDPKAPRPGEPQAQVAIIGGRYFESVSIPLRSGRSFNDDDREGSTPVMIVSESVANRYFPGGALHQRVLIPEIKFNITGSGERWIAREIVGVVSDVIGTSINEGGVLHLYLPESQNAIRFTYLALRTDRDPISMTTAVHRAIYSEVPDLPISGVRSLEDRAAFLTDPPRQGMWLLSVFSALALVLAAIGVYGVMASAVAQRRRELGIRSALGATPRQIIRLIAGQGFRLIAAGITLGTAGALALTRALEHLLYGVAPTDLLAFGSAALALIFAAIFAGIGPAKAGASVDPASVLRAE